MKSIHCINENDVGVGCVCCVDVTVNENCDGSCRILVWLFQVDIFIDFGNDNPQHIGDFDVIGMFLIEDAMDVI
jgi:hypothetical protein